MQIFVKRLAADTLVLEDVEPSASARSIKTKISAHTGIVEQEQVLFSSQFVYIKDSCALSQCNIETEPVLHLLSESTMNIDPPVGSVWWTNVADGNGERVYFGPVADCVMVTVLSHNEDNDLYSIRHVQHPQVREDMGKESFVREATAAEVHAVVGDGADKTRALQRHATPHGRSVACRQHRHKRDLSKRGGRDETNKSFGEARHEKRSRSACSC